MPRRNIGGPRPRFRGVSMRFRHSPIGGTVLFLKVANNGTPWTVPAGVTRLRDVWALSVGTNGGNGGKGGAGPGGDGATLARITNRVVVPLTTINFHVGVGGLNEGSWFSGTSSADALLFADVFAGVSVGDELVAGDPHVGTQGGAAAFFGVIDWTQTIGGELAAPGALQAVEGAAGNLYGGAGAGGATGGGIGGNGANGLIVVSFDA